MKVDEYLKGLRRFGIEYQPKTEEEYVIVQKAYVIDTIGYELYRFAKVGMAFAQAINKLCIDTFTEKEIMEVTDRNTKIANKITQETIENIGKRLLFDIGITAEGIRKLDFLLVETMKDLGQGNIFNMVIVPYSIYVQLAYPNIFKHMIGFDQNTVNEFKEGCKYFEENIYKKYFEKLERRTTLQSISTILNLTGYLVTMSDSLANVVANKLREELMKLGGVPYGEEPSD